MEVDPDAGTARSRMTKDPRIAGTVFLLDGEASGDAIAQEFEKYLRRGGDGPRGLGPGDSRRQ